MKKIFLFIISLVSLLLSLSLFTVAYSNEYTFSQVWNNKVFLNSYTLVNNNNSPANVELAPILGLDNGSDSTSFGGYNSSVSFSGLSYYGYTSSADVSVPVGIYVNEYSNFTWDLYLLYRNNTSTSAVNNITLTCTAVTSTDSIINIPCTLTYYPSGYLATLTYTTGGGVESMTTTYEADGVYLVSLNFNPTSNYTIDYLNFSFTTSMPLRSFVLGAIGSKVVISLPDSVDKYLANISNRINLTNSRILTLINELRSTNTKIDDILEALASSAAGTTVLTQFLQTPSAEQQEVTEKLEQLLEEAQEELAAVKEVLDSVQTPSIEDIISENINEHIEVIDTFRDDNLATVTSSVFEFPGVVSMLLITFSLATFSYILFGKKG